MASTIWKGHLTFGLISVPVKLFAAARTETVGFNQLHAACGSRIRMQTFCPTCNRAVERRELIKGYEVEAGRWVTVDEGDLDRMVPPSAKTLEVQSFVRMAEVDPVFFNTSYYMVADGAAGEKAYALLVQALEHAGYAGIARITMHQREHVVIVRPAMGGLMLHTLYYADEVRKVDEYGRGAAVEVSAKERELAEMFISALAAPFDPGGLRDRYRDGVMEMIAAKAAGQEVKAPAPVPQAPILDLMAALKASIEKTRPAAEETSGGPPPAETPQPAAVPLAPPAAPITLHPAAEAPPVAPITAPAAAERPRPTPALPEEVEATTTSGSGASTPTVTITATSDAPRLGRKKPPVRVTSTADARPDAIAQ